MVFFFFNVGKEGKIKKKNKKNQRGTEIWFWGIKV